MSKVFVADAAGFTGAALLGALVEKGVAAVAGIHGVGDGCAPDGWSGETRKYAFDDAAVLAGAMAGCDALYLAPPFDETMARSGSVAVEAARQAGIGFIVLMSRYGASSDAHWRLGREVGMIDQFVEDSGIPFTVLRANTFMQKFTTLLAGEIRSGRVPLPEESCPVSYLDADDAALCAARLFADREGHGNRTYALTGPEGLTGADVAARIAGATGKAMAYESVDEDAFIALLDAAGLSEWRRNMEVSLSRVVKLGMMGNVTGAVKFLTGAPPRAFADFAAARLAAWS
ncbi:MAG: NmrA family NAD(P)-binding protein [Pseudodesulfovibrio sp.]